MIIRFSPDADAELAEARQWYVHQREDLAVEFMECILSPSAFIRNNSFFEIRAINSDVSQLPEDMR
jgi:hypothetical protein